MREEPPMLDLDLPAQPPKGYFWDVSRNRDGNYRIRLRKRKWFGKRTVLATIESTDKSSVLYAASAVLEILKKNGKL